MKFFNQQREDAKNKFNNIMYWFTDLLNLEPLKRRLKPSKRLNCPIKSSFRHLTKIENRRGSKSFSKITLPVWCFYLRQPVSAYVNGNLLRMLWILDHFQFWRQQRTKKYKLHNSSLEKSNKKLNPHKGI